MFQNCSYKGEHGTEVVFAFLVTDITVPFSPLFNGVKLGWKINLLSPAWSKFKFATFSWMLRNAAPTHSLREGGGGGF
jgi:hypothetical protein